MKTIRMHEIDTEEFQVGDQITIALDGKDYTATVQQVTDEGYIVMFDDCVAEHEMNSEWTNKGGFDASDMKKFLQEELLPKFPEDLRPRIKNITLPTVGQIFGHEDQWCNRTFEPDTDEQFPLMKSRKNRVADFDGDWDWWWLANATKQSVSSTFFAYVVNYGIPYYYIAGTAFGVRPVFLLVR